MKPVLEFRPLPGFFRGEFRRYADGAWIPDDGEYDLAFIGWASSGAGSYSCCLYFSHNYQKNIVQQWVDGHWACNESRHPRGNAWHYVLAVGETEWGGEWGLNSHPNTRAGDAGMSKMSSENGCANGRHVSPSLGDKHVEAALVRYQDTREVFQFAHGNCMYCGDSSLSAMQRKQL